MRGTSSMHDDAQEEPQDFRAGWPNGVNRDAGRGGRFRIAFAARQ